MNLSNVIDYLGPLQFSGFQIAENDDWKNNLKIQASPSSDQIAAATKMVQDAGNDISLEVMFSLRDEEFMFFGFSLVTTPKESQVKIIDECLRTISTRDGFIDIIEKVRTLTKLEMFTTDYEFMEIGIFNLWIDVGSQVIFRKSTGDAPLPFEDIAEKLKADYPTPAMLEVGWSKPYAHFIGLPLCIRDDSKNAYRLDRTRYNEALKAALS